MLMRNTFQILVLLIALFGLGLGAAYAGGVYMGRRDTPAASATPSAAPSGLPSAAAAGGFGAGGGGAAAGATTGVVEEVSGDTITIRTAAGGTVAVKLQDDTQIRQLASASPSDIKPGLNVIVQGPPDIDGRVAARSVQITGPAQTPGGGAGQAGPRGAGSGVPGTRTPGQVAPASPAPSP
jgi:hypothetical protein